MEIAIRRAEPRDASDVHAVLRAAFDPLRSRYTEGAFAATTLSAPKVIERLDEGPVWVADVDGAAVGTISLRIDRDGGYVRGMGVTPAAQGRGIGTMLMDELDAYSADREIAPLWLYTTSFLHAAIRLYQRYAFDIDPTDSDAHLYGTPLVRMVRV